MKVPSIHSLYYYTKKQYSEWMMKIELQDTFINLRTLKLANKRTGKYKTWKISNAYDTHFIVLYHIILNQ